MNRPAALRIARARPCACAVLSLLAIALPPAAAGATRTGASHTKAPLFPIPASARVHSETPHTTATATTAAPATAKAPATTTPATSVPPAATATPSATTPASAVPPAARSGGTTAPATTTPATTTPATAAPPGGAQGGIPTAGASAPTTAAPGSTRLLGTAARKRSSSGKLSTGAIAGAAAAGLLVLLSLAWALVRWFALEPRWTRSLAYSLEEAGFRASSTFSELLDWARLGR